jgi:hypothetical protein
VLSLSGIVGCESMRIGGEDLEGGRRAREKPGGALVSSNLTFPRAASAPAGHPGRASRPPRQPEMRNDFLNHIEDGQSGGQLYPAGKLDSVEMTVGVHIAPLV